MATALTQPYSGYHHGEVPAPDLELTQVGPGTPGGEYLRRFWHPIALTASLNDLPKRVRVLGEDLVLFRDGRGEIGLLDLHCSHRGTSLEFGMVQNCGIRCCYHGWVYDVDGRVLETPGEPPDSTFKDKFFHGAYPTIDYKGLIFAYLGPPETRPEFPIFDSFELPGYRMFPGGTADERYIYDCNWLQLAENNGDVVHFVFLHYPEPARTRLNRYRPSANPDASMDDYFGVGQVEWDEEIRGIVEDYRLRVLEWQETPVGVMSIHTRRVGEFVWVRLGDYMMPNVDQFAPTSQVPDHELEFGPPYMTAWTVPVDDTHTMSFQFRYVREEVAQAPRASQLRTSESLDRSYGDRQREPGDYEAQESQRPIAVHAREHLGTTDGGVVLVRKLLREGIRAVQRGEDPRRVVPGPGLSIPTYCRNTIVRIPPAATPEADRELLRSTARQHVAALLARAPQPAIAV
jgi:phenylpropionate dioxygenase-like ring-hydroxylating dioxygenase large terminal subunit